MEWRSPPDNSGPPRTLMPEIKRPNELRYGGVGLRQHQNLRQVSQGTSEEEKALANRIGALVESSQKNDSLR